MPLPPLEQARKDALDSVQATLAGNVDVLESALASRDPTRRTPQRIEKLKANVAGAKAALDAAIRNQERQEANAARHRDLGNNITSMKRVTP